MCSTGSTISELPRPTRTAAPAGPTALMPSETARGAPLASMKASTGTMSEVTSTETGSTTSVAPKDSARSRRSGTRSLTTTRVAPNARATCAQMTPIGPAPAMRTLDPGTIPALRAAAMPTDRGSSRAPASNDTVSGRVCANSASIVTYSANAPSTGGVA